MPFEKGRDKTGGRRSGTSNRLTGAFREAVQIVYNGLGGHESFLRWARENPTEYYKIAARLIPAEMREDTKDKTITVIVNRGCGEIFPVRPQPVLEDHSCKEAGT